MRILFYSWEYPPNGSGVATYVDNMSRTLVQLGHQVMVATGHANGFPEQSTRDGVVIRRCYDWRDVRSTSTGERILHLAHEFNADLIEAGDHLGQSATILGDRSRPPVMVRMHSCNVHNVLQRSQVWYFWQYLTIGIARMRLWSQVKAEARSLAFADAVLASSQALLNASVSQGLTLPAVKGAVPNPYVMPGSICEATKDELDVPTLLFVGRIDIGKGIGYLPGIMKRLVERIPTVQLQIAGGDSYARFLGSMRTWLQNRFADAGVADHVRFLGHLSWEDLDEAYRRSWVQVIPSRWDTFPGVALEAMARKKPVIASPNGGLPEMLQNTGMPVLDPSKSAFVDEIVRLLRDRSLRKELGVAGYQRVCDHYSPLVVGQQYMEFLSSWMPL